MNRCPTCGQTLGDDVIIQGGVMYKRVVTVVKRVSVDSYSTWGKKYEIVKYRDGTKTCNCPDWVNRHAQYEKDYGGKYKCKHLRDNGYELD